MSAYVEDHPKSISRELVHVALPDLLRTRSENQPAIRRDDRNRERSRRRASDLLEVVEQGDCTGVHRPHVGLNVVLIVVIDEFI